MQTNRVETAVRGWALLLILASIATAQQIAIGGYAVPTVESELVGITVGSDGAIWFTEASPSANKIGRITTEGAITEYLIPRTTVEPTSITAGPDGALWFTEFNAGSVGRITTAGAISQFRVPNVVHGPSAITAGPDGALWFATGMSNEIGRITTEGSIELFTVPTSRSNPSGITAGPDGALWFTEQNGNKIGRHAGALQELVAAGHIEIVPLGDTGWEHFETLVVGPAAETLDDGEAATIAYAAERGAVAVLDERKGTRICASRFPSLGVISTVDVLLHPEVRLKLGDGAFADAVFAALRDARMAVFAHHLDEVLRFIGPERAARCPSLPKGRRVSSETVAR